MVDDLYGRRERPDDPIEVDRAGERCNRACRCRSTVAFWSSGKQLGVALVQTGDGVAQVVGGEDLTPLPSPLSVDLDEVDVDILVGTDIETPAREPAGAH